MKKFILGLAVLITSICFTGCSTMSDIVYSDVYISGHVSYPVTYINSYPYYWFNGHWTLVPTYRYRMIRPLERPRHFVAKKPSPTRYGYRYYPPTNGQRPNNVRPARPHTPQQGRPNPNRNRSNYGGRR